jgi:hypothetical protein
MSLLADVYVKALFFARYVTLPTMRYPLTLDLPTLPEFTTATFAVDIAVLATDSDPTIVSQKLQTSLAEIKNWFKNWRIKVNGSKSLHVTFTT